MKLFLVPILFLIFCNYFVNGFNMAIYKSMKKSPTTTSRPTMKLVPPIYVPAPIRP
ncbi:uncharacterized protein CELE_ZK938.12 [Caenorhabditis elegans]|uniref:Uncharacterized protein n=1 Tax=Caenorhabditis elegans TaxID=6239 RepID=A0A2C9C356_CAEEL|nr:Uncharacterized protein CELE_ZK938.12 [Caenorhabditis elegans]SOF58782.1 Uncharacterized protein CELE_ZK938.12 [Caenorhabditis elegans]|eukprot:NP_001343790.1 Uncharacterized protein CELE_ZK938.12 [Caenorhabditis elegans]